MVHRSFFSIVFIVIALTGSFASAADLTVINPGFEDVTGQSPFNEFTFGTPAGWNLYDTNNIINDGGTFTGTLQPNGAVFFNSTAPEGVKVGILFNSGAEGEGEYGYIQTLSDTLQANTQYSLTAEVGNITSGTSVSGSFFDLSEFPGYRVELLAGGVVVAQDNNTLVIPEGEFATATVMLDVGDDHAQLGEALSIRLVNLNVLPGGFTQETSPDLEVDFDDIALTAILVPEPSTLIMTFAFAATLLRRRQMR